MNRPVRNPPDVFGDLDRLQELYQCTPDRLAVWSDKRLRDFWFFRLNFLEEELDETTLAKTAGDAVDGLIDLIVVAVGTLEAFGVDGPEAWRRVQVANMAKVAGVNPKRENPFGLPDLVKPEGWKAPTHADLTGLLARVL